MAKSKEVEFFNVLNALPDGVDGDVVKKECLTGHDLQPCPPFAIINPSHIYVGKDGIPTLYREYSWAKVNSLDKDFSDFSRLHKLVIKYIRNDLIDTVNTK